MQFGFHVGEVAHPFAAGGAYVEGVGIGVDVDALELAVDDAGQHLLQLRVFVSQLYVGPYLGTRVAQPHGVDVAGVYKGVVVAVEVYGGVERVGETVLEHPGEAGVGEQGLHPFDLFLYGT